MLVAHSPFLHGLFTSGLAESAQSRVELLDIDGLVHFAWSMCSDATYHCGIHRPYASLMLGGPSSASVCKLTELSAYFIDH